MLRIQKSNRLNWPQMKKVSKNQKPKIKHR